MVPGSQTQCGDQDTISKRILVKILSEERETLPSLRKEIIRNETELSDSKKKNKKPYHS